MLRRPPRSPRTDTRFPYPALGRSLMFKIANEPHAPLLTLRPDLPAPVDLTIARVLQKNPDLRYAAGAEMAIELRKALAGLGRSAEHTSELQSLMRNSYAVFCLQNKALRAANPGTHTRRAPL